MARDAQQSAKWNFTVVQEQIKHKGKALPFWGNFRTDTGECLGMASESYGIVQNRELIKAAEEALDLRGLSGYEKSIIVAGSGEQLYADFTFRNKQIAGAVGDIFGYILRLRNSFDRSLRVAFELGFLRLVCKNGAATLEKEFSATRKHSSQVTVGFLGDAIDRAFNAGQHALKIYEQMGQTPITDEQGKTVLLNLEAMGVLSGVLRESIETNWLAPKLQEDKARNLWTLYNAATAHLTHQVQTERYVYAQKVNNNLLLRLANAARNKDTLAKLILPVPAEKQAKVVVEPGNVADASGAGALEVEVVG